MTSIHAVIPAGLQSAVDAAQCRGEDAKSQLPKLASRKRPHLVLEPTPPAQPDYDSDVSDDEASASKENDPSISPLPVTMPDPPQRRPFLPKRPLSDLPTPVESPTDDEDETCSGMTSSERNIAANTPNLSSTIACMAVSERPGPRLVERSRSFNFASRPKEEPSVEGLMIIPFEDNATDCSTVERDYDMEQPAAKRVCSGEEKENITEAKPAQPAPLSKPTVTGGLVAKVSNPAELRKVSSASGSSSSGSMRAVPKARTGLRRL